MSNIPVLLHWLRWSPGSGQQILIGRDKLIGLEDSSLLSTTLICYLNRINITVLAQLRDPSSIVSFPEIWKNTDTLGLTGELATEWNSYSTTLRGAGILLRNKADSLMWTRGNSSGSISVKNIYNALLNYLDIPFTNEWLKKL